LEEEDSVSEEDFVAAESVVPKMKDEAPNEQIVKEEQAFGFVPWSVYAEWIRTAYGTLWVLVPLVVFFVLI
jgi:hypothetical protein